MQQGPPREFFLLKESNPRLTSSDDNTHLRSSYDLVEKMQFLYVRVVKARDLAGKGVTGSCDPYVEVRVGNYKGNTSHFIKKSNPEWEQVFAVSKDLIHASVLEVMVKDKDDDKNNFIGRFSVDLNEIPERVPPEAPLAPQWYKLKDGNNGKSKGEIMVAVWWGTQADDVFPQAWHLSLSDAQFSNSRSKVYLSPQLWYLRVNVIGTKDLQPSDESRISDVYVKATLGNRSRKTRVLSSTTKMSSAVHDPMWNEDLMCVAAEPFDEQLILSVEECVTPYKVQVLGRCVVPLQTVDRRLNNKVPVNPRWYDLEKGILVEGGKGNNEKFAGKIHMSVCLEGGYHVLLDSSHYSTDFRPTSRQLQRPSIGILELGILDARGILPMKIRHGRGTVDAYCVAKYGMKWIKTRTIIDSFAPRWNEQYTWEVYDPCTVLNIGVFDNCNLQGGDEHVKDSRIGKVSIRLSTLESDRVYTCWYPLLVVHPTGVRKMGEIHLAFRYTISSLVNTMHKYLQALFPEMHYVHPLTTSQLDYLRPHAMEIVSTRLGKAMPPLRKEVVEYMLDSLSSMWSMRKSKASFNRMMDVLSGLITVGKWFKQISNWKNPAATIVVHVLYLMFVMFPKLILPFMFFSLFLIGVFRYRFRFWYPPQKDICLSGADDIDFDDLDEEFDTFPSSRHADTVRMRYDRLRRIAGRIQKMLGDLATDGERIQSLLSWQDPRASALFAVFCLIGAVAVSVIPFQVMALLAGFYMLRPPLLKNKFSSAPLNFFRRLPIKMDCLL